MSYVQITMQEIMSLTSTAAEMGVLEKVKNGEGQNSAAYYSKAAIQKLLRSIKVKQTVNDQPVRVRDGNETKETATISNHND